MTRRTRVPIDTKHLIELTNADLAADYTQLRRIVHKLARELEQAGETAAATELRASIKKSGVPLRASGYMESLPVDAKSRLPLVEEQPWPSNPIFLNETAARTFADFISDVENIDQ